MDLLVHPPGTALWGDRRLRCALGEGGVAVHKREGDGCTPAGDFVMRRVLFRADRIARPRTRLAAEPLSTHDAWCDDPDDPLYNRQVELPFAGRTEHLWRADHIYDLIVVLGFNDAPPSQGLGSAIFMHVAKPAFAPTRGCIALALDDLLDVLEVADPDSTVRVRRAPA